jgi:hypothetical protein
MTIDQTIALFSSIGACLAALAALWAVREMKRQRASQVRREPQIWSSQISLPHFCTLIYKTKIGSNLDCASVIHTSTKGCDQWNPKLPNCLYGLQ